ncbi:MAG: molybdopterin-dependent oxidoreductase [Treponemataceae bacterium]
MKNKFTSDLSFPNMAEAVLVRADKTGILKDIIVPELPEGCNFFSAKDIPGEKEIKIFNYAIPVFAFEKIDFVGQAVGILIGAEKEMLLNLRKSFRVIVEDKNINNENTDSQKKFFEYPVMSERSFEVGNWDEVFETENKTISSLLMFESRYHYRSEPACVKVVNGKEETCEVYLATQWPFSVAETVASTLDINKKDVNIHLMSFGEHINSLVWFPSLLASQCAVATKLSGRNISLKFSRVEDYSYTTASPHVLIRHKTAVSDFEKILGMQVEVLIDAGAFCPIIDEMILQILTVSSGIYAIPNLQIKVKAFKTQSKPTDFFAGLGESYILSALEKHINEIILEKNFSPIEFRLQNINTENTNFDGKILLTESFDFSGLLKTVCSASDYHRKYYAYKVLNKSVPVNSKTRLRGIGLSTGLQYSGINSFIKRGINYSVEMTLTTDGKAIVTVVDCTDDLKKMFAKKISNYLGIDETNIKFIDADEKNFNIIKTMENNILYLTNLIQKCCESIERMRFRKPLPITVKKKYRVAKKKDWNPETLEGVPFKSETGGACVVELELNPVLYRVKIKNIWLSVAPGAVFKKLSVIQKIKKEIQNCVSQLTLENSSVTNFFQFRILNIADAPKMHVKILQSDEKNAVYKGVENIANNLVPAAFASALEQIFIQSDEPLFSLPVTNEKIYDKILQMQAKAELAKQAEIENENSTQANEVEENVKTEMQV